MSVWTKKDVRTRIISTTGRDRTKSEQEHVTNETNEPKQASIKNDTTVTSDDKGEKANDTPVKEKVPDSTSETLAEPENHDEIDPVILSALFDVRNRMFVLRLEQTMCNFIKSPQTEMDLDPMNSFYRLVAHKVADYYGLGHLSNNDSASVTLFKEKEVRLPSVRLSNIRPPVKSQDGESGSEGTSQVPSSPSSGQVTPTTRRRPKLLTKGQIVDGLAAMNISQDRAQGSSEGPTRPTLQRPSPTKPSVHSQSQQSSQLAQSSSNSNSNPETKSNFESKSQSNSEPKSQSIESAPKGLGSFEQRVAAYMEARARIFEGFEQQDDSQVDQDQQTTQRFQLDEWDPEYSRDAFVRPATVPIQSPPYQSQIQPHYQSQFQPPYPNQYQFHQHNQQYYDQYRQHYNHVPYPPGPPGTPGAPYPPMHFNNPGPRPKHSQYDNQEPS